MVRPYFLSNPFTEAITTDAQSVSGMKPMLRLGFSGASEPAAHAPWRTPGGTMAMRTAATESPVVFFMKSRLLWSCT